MNYNIIHFKINFKIFNKIIMILFNIFKIMILVYIKIFKMIFK
jgi:hypothetical protein